MTKRLSTYISRLNQEERENVNISITSPDLESVIKNLSTHRSFEADNFTGEFYQTFREALIIIPLQLFRKLKKREYFPTHSESKIILMLKSQKATEREGNHRKGEGNPL